MIKYLSSLYRGLAHKQILGQSTPLPYRHLKFQNSYLFFLAIHPLHCPSNTIRMVFASITYTMPQQGLALPIMALVISTAFLTSVFMHTKWFHAQIVSPKQFIDRSIQKIFKGLSVICQSIDNMSPQHELPFRRCQKSIPNLIRIDSSTKLPVESTEWHAMQPP